MLGWQAAFCSRVFLVSRFAGLDVCWLRLGCCLSGMFHFWVNRLSCFASNQHPVDVICCLAWLVSSPGLHVCWPGGGCYLLGMCHLWVEKRRGSSQNMLPRLGCAVCCFGHASGKNVQGVFGWAILISPSHMHH